MLSSMSAAETIGKELCNWTRWGPNDQLGTLNFITETTTFQAAQLVKTGQIYPLGLPLANDGPITTSPHRFNPIHLMERVPEQSIREGDVGTADDVIIMPLQCTTQWDALAHISHKGLLYGGRPASLVTVAGAGVNDVCNLTSRMATRGVLIDVAAARGVSNLEPGDAIEATEIESICTSQGVKVLPGDILLFRTGHLEYCRAREWRGFDGDAPGLGLSALRWLHDRDVAAVAADTYALEVKPYQLRGQASPFHVVALAYMGMVIGEMFDLSELSQACHADGTYIFFLVAAGIPVIGGVGTPVNPYAIK